MSITTKTQQVTPQWQSNLIITMPKEGLPHIHSKLYYQQLIKTQLHINKNSIKVTLLDGITKSPKKDLETLVSTRINLE